MEDCWFKDKHQELGKEPLDCLNCNRMAGKLIDKPDDPDLCLFIDGYRLALCEIANYAQPFTKEQVDMIQGLEIRFKCAIDRGIPLEQLKYAVNYISNLIFRDLLKGKKES
jgi:hypothetical protein